MRTTAAADGVRPCWGRLGSGDGCWDVVEGGRIRSLRRGVTRQDKRGSKIAVLVALSIVQVESSDWCSALLGHQWTGLRGWLRLKRAHKEDPGL